MIKEKPQSRERLLLHGCDELGDDELLAIVLGTGHHSRSALGLAHDLLETHGGLAGLAATGTTELGKQCGVGLAKAARVLAGFELGRRVQALGTALVASRFLCFEDVVAWAKPRLSSLPHEEVWLIGLDGRNGLLFTRNVARGGMHGCALTAKEVLRPAIREGACAIVLVHNHPSGDPTPSPDDVLLTNALSLAAEAVGIALLDHVIVARGGAESLLERPARQVFRSVA